MTTRSVGPIALLLLLSAAVPASALLPSCSAYRASTATGADPVERLARDVAVNSLTEYRQRLGD